MKRTVEINDDLEQRVNLAIEKARPNNSQTSRAIQLKYSK